MAGTTGFKLFAILVIIQVEAKPRIVNLSGEPDFRKVTLRWQVDPDGETVTGMFRVKYCENQVWGEHFCRHKSVRQKPTQENFSADILGRAYIDEHLIFCGFRVRLPNFTNRLLSPNK